MKCNRINCSGSIEDGYCSVCALAPLKEEQIVAQKQVEAAKVAQANKPKPAPAVKLTVPEKTRRIDLGFLNSVIEKNGGQVDFDDPAGAVLTDPKVPVEKLKCTAFIGELKCPCNAQLRKQHGYCPDCGIPYDFRPKLKPDTLVANQYKVLGAIAFGSFGWIYLAEDVNLHRYAVLKGLLNTGDEKSRQVAEAEAKALAALDHPNIVKVYGMVQHKEHSYIAMEYVQGRTLKSMRKDNLLNPVAASAYIVQVLSAFSYLHEKGYVYCDCKPHNIIVAENGVKLIDLGSLRHKDSPDVEVFATQGFIPPELQEGIVEPAFDLFSLGRTLAMLIAEFNVREYEYELPDQVDIPAFLEHEALYRLLLKATRQSPEQRFQSADEMQDQLYGIVRARVVDQVQIEQIDSLYFTPSSRDTRVMIDSFEMDTRPDYKAVPEIVADINDPDYQLVLSIKAKGVSEQVKLLNNNANGSRPTQSVERLVRLAELSLDGSVNGASIAMSFIRQLDVSDYRHSWLMGKAHMYLGDLSEAYKEFHKLSCEMPGELAPRLACALIHESEDKLQEAMSVYELITKIDSRYVSAVLGLARCSEKLGHTSKSVSAYYLVNEKDAHFNLSRLKIAKLLLQVAKSPFEPDNRRHEALDSAAEALMQAKQVTDSFTWTNAVAELYSTASVVVSATLISTGLLLNVSREPKALRRAAESAYRKCALMAQTKDQALRYVDMANRVRPHTLF